MSTIEDVQRLIGERDLHSLRDRLVEVAPVEVAEVFNDLSDEERVLIFRILPRDNAAEIFSQLEVDVQKKVLSGLGDRQRTRRAAVSACGPLALARHRTHHTGAYTQHCPAHVSGRKKGDAIEAHKGFKGGDARKPGPTCDAAEEFDAPNNQERAHAGRRGTVLTPGKQKKG